MFTNWKCRIEVLLYCIMSLLWCCDKPPNNYLWGKLSWHIRCCHWSFWALKVEIFRFISPLKTTKKKHIAPCIFYVYATVIFMQSSFTVDFSPSCVDSEAPLDLLLLNISDVSAGLLQSGYELFKYTSFHCVLITVLLLVLVCREGKVLTAAHLSWHWTSMSNLSQLSGI